MNALTSLISDFIELFFPNFCICCNDKLVKAEKYFCSNCFYDLPKTNFLNLEDNPVTQMFWGRVQIEFASAFFYFEKGSKLQQIIHYFKYKGYKEIGYEIGKIMGVEIIKSYYYNAVDVVVPVPLHSKKKKKRGYNQSEWLANGIAEVLHVPVNNEILYRQIANPTQTMKTRFERWENVENIFEIRNPEDIANKHVLLVDDIITTGSTLESCTLELQKAGQVKVSIIVIAMA